MPRNSRSSAFTLLELMMVVVVIGVLTAIAFPAFREYKNRAKLAEAYTVIDVMKKNQISYYLTNTYFCAVTVPNGGRESDGFRFMANSDWQQLGYPVPVGTVTYFNYRASAGETNKSKSPPAFPVSSLCRANSSMTSPALSVFAGTLTYGGESLRQCESSAMTGAALGADTAPTTPYDWVAIGGKANLDMDQSNECHGAAMLLQTRNMGADFVTSPIITVQINNGVIQ